MFGNIVPKIHRGPNFMEHDVDIGL